MPTAAVGLANSHRYLKNCPRADARPTGRCRSRIPGGAGRGIKAARNRLPILIVGEAGTGKETFARAIHHASLRAKGPFVQIDCKAVAANIIDSELFGHMPGLPGRLLGTRWPHCRSRWRHR
jgi:transcriptional regulator of acetoin/glycerol metabolism